MDTSYKARKEAFVSDLSGGSILEINIVTLVASVSGQEHCFADTILNMWPLLYRLRRFSGLRCSRAFPSLLPITLRRL